MILRTRQTSIACARCQMRLSSLMGGAGSRPRALAPLSQPSLHALRARRAYSDAPNDASDAEPITNSAAGENNEHKPLQIWRHETGTVEKRYLPEAQWMRAKHLVRANLKEKSAPVEVESLGRPTNIVVLRESIVSREPRRVIDKPPPIVIENETLDIYAEIQKDVGIAGAEEVIKNINSIRPRGKSSTRPLTWEQMSELERKLVQGFTKAQMLAYIQTGELGILKRAEEKREEEKEAIREMIQAPWLSVKETNLAAPDQGSTTQVLRETPWMPGKSPHGDYFENSSLRGYISDATTSKAKLALFILRTCWGLEAEEYQTSVGEKELTLAPEDLELLISPRMKNPPLKVISDALINTPEEKIEAYRARNVVRITGTRAQTEAIARGIQSVLANIRVYRISLAELKRTDSHEFNTAVYEELERLTNAEVVRLSKDMVILKGMNFNPGSGLSTMADVARRVLLSSSDAADQSIRNVGLKITDQPAYAVEWVVEDGMSWRNKMRHWVRWESPIEKSIEEPVNQKEYVMELEELTGSEKAAASEAAAIKPPRAESELMPYDVSGLSPSSEIAQISPTALWQSAHRESCALVGNLLHETTEAQSPPVSPTPLSIPTHTINTHRSLFVSQSRNLSHLADYLNPIHTYRRVFFKFLPSPWTPLGGDALHTFPPIEMEFKQSGDGPLTLKSIFAISEDVHNDVMIPDRTLDVSFRQLTKFRMSTMGARRVASLQEFVRKSNLVMDKGEIITPAEVSLPISKYVCREGTEVFGDRDTMDVQYLFAGLEFRQSNTFDYHGFSLRYSSINGGKAAGHRSELALDYALTNPTSTSSATSSKATQEDEDKLLREFTAAAFQLVDDLDTPRPVKVRRLEQDAEEEITVPISYELFPSVRRVMVKKESPMPDQFTCFVHRPLVSRIEEEMEMEMEEEMEDVAEVKDIPETEEMAESHEVAEPEKIRESEEMREREEQEEVKEQEKE